MDNITTTTLTADLRQGDDEQLAQFLAECILFESADGEPLDGAQPGLGAGGGAGERGGADTQRQSSGGGAGEARQSLSPCKGASESAQRIREMGYEGFDITFLNLQFMNL